MFYDWGSTVGHPSNNWASCCYCRHDTVHPSRRNLMRKSTPSIQPPMPNLRLIVWTD